MAETAVLRLEEMLPEVVHLEERGIFTKDELKVIMTSRRKFEYAICSRATTLKDFMQYIQHEIDIECIRRKKFTALNIKTTVSKDASILQRIHSIFNRALSKFSSNVDLWDKYIEFCASAGSSNQLNKILMRAIKRHPRASKFRILAADRELQLGALSEARKLLMRAIRVKTDEHTLVWEQLFKLECVAVHRMVTAPPKSTRAEATATDNDGEPETEGPLPSCEPALVVFKHGLADLSKGSKNDTSKFIQFAMDAFSALEMSILGFKQPLGLASLKSTITSAYKQSSS